MYTYLLIDCLSLLVPLIASFHPKLQFNKQWKYLFPAIGIAGIVLIVWDVLFTKWGIWGFSDQYLIGVEIAQLPLEEWLFFVCIPYACVFTYEALNKLSNWNPNPKTTNIITIAIILVCLVLAVLNFDKAYTFTASLFTAVLLLLHLLVLKTNYLGKFYRVYAIILIPFLIVNGILTGTFLDGQVVWYNNAENLSIRIFTIPVEDTIYNLYMLLSVITVYEGLKGKALVKPSDR
jgi:lycopene cyclase domain-containing protein